MTVAPAQLISALVIDDNAHMRVLLRGLLMGLGVRKVVEASDAGDAFEVLETQVFDFILCDVHMIGLDGIEFTQMLRRAERQPNRYTPVIMVSGHSTRAKVAAARDAGADWFLVKPIAAASIQEKMNAVLNRRRPIVHARLYVGPCRRLGEHNNSYIGPRRRLDDEVVPIVDSWTY